MTRVLCFGECMVERSQSRAAAFAGDAFNVAAHLKWAEPEIDVAFATVTGDDDESRAMRATWSRLGIDGSLSPAITGIHVGAYSVETNAAGERRFVYDRANSAARRWFEELAPRAQALAGADLIFMTGVSLAILPPAQRLPALAFVAGLAPNMLAFDPNVRPALWESRETMRAVLEAAMGMAGVLLPSLDDLIQLWGEARREALLDRCRSLGPSEVAMTLGSDGCMVAYGGKPPVRLRSAPVRVLDTAGAGDAFGGAYLAARLAGKSTDVAARAGLERAALTVALRGALPMELFPCR